MSDLRLEIKRDPQGGYVVVDVNGVLIPAGEELGGAPTKEEAKYLVEDLQNAYKTGEGR